MAGTVSGTVQVARGCIAMPGSCAASVKGQDWDEQRREYKDHVAYMLRAEAQQVLEEEERANRMFTRSGRTV
eukprot:SAG11_NODE_12808_length_684_cov_1.049573_1_plen_71_part_10